LGVLATYRQLLRNGPLTRLLIGEFVSSIGDWLYLVALVILVYRETEDPVLLGLIGAARLLPYVLLSIPAGVIGDRFDRRYVLLVSDLARAACMVALTIMVSTGAPLAAIAIVAIVAACFAPFFYPAFGALLPSLVRDEREYGPANSAWATLDNAAWIVGPGLAGVIVATAGVELAFLINAVSFSLIAVVLFTLPKPQSALPTRVPEAAEAAGAPAPAAPTSGEPASAAPEPSAPAHAAPARAPVAPNPARRRGLRERLPNIDLSAVSGVLLLDMLTWFAFGGVNILIVVLAIDVFQGGDAATGYLSAATGVGGVAGAVLSGVLVLRARLAPALFLAAAAFTASLVLLGIANTLVAAFVAIAVASVGHLILDVIRTTILQRTVPDAYRGRFTGVLMTTSGGAEALGTLVVPVLMSIVGLPLTLAVTAGGLLLGTFVSVALIGRAADVAVGPHDAVLRRLARLPVFGGLSAARLEDALRQLAPIPVAAGDVVIRQGDVADRFYVIASGRFEVTQTTRDGAPPTPLRKLGPEEVFGELGLLRRTRRTATVTALEEGLLFAMDGEAFLEIVGARRGAADRLLELYDPSPTSARA
jgi:MFS family permease